MLNDTQDVSANGDNIAVYVGGKFGLSGGTSAATPIFSSIVNRIIEARLAIGKGPLGFLNPALYANPWVLNDITNGTNPGCGTNGFSAVKGWDPVRHSGFCLSLAVLLTKPGYRARNTELSTHVRIVSATALSGDWCRFPLEARRTNPSPSFFTTNQ